MLDLIRDALFFVMDEALPLAVIALCLALLVFSVP